jgi:hypothetical protein
MGIAYEQAWQRVLPKDHPKSYIYTSQCTNGTFSGGGATACTVCSAGKYLTNSSGITEAASCTAVSMYV